MAIKTNLKSLESARTAYQKPVVLLSHGYFAKEQLPGGSIVVFPWDNDVDDWIQQRVRKPNRDRLLWELTAMLCNTNGVPIEKFPIGDINTILMVARSILHDSVVVYEPVCPVCGQKNPVTQVLIPDELERIGEKTDDYPGFDEVTLKKSGDVVRFRPLTVGDEIAIADRDKATKKAISDRVARIYATILEIGGGKPDDVKELDTWWRALHPKDKSQFEAEQDATFPHLGTDLEHQCDSCSATFVHSLSIDNEFFRKGRTG